MQAIDTSSLDIYVAFGQRRGNDTLHWILMLAHPGSDRCTWYHVIGGPTQGRPYEPKIEANKRVHSFGISSKQWISRVSASEINKIKAATKAVPLQRCQRWTTEVLGVLERKGLVPSGTRDHFYNQIEPSRYEQTGNTSNSGTRSSGSVSGRAPTGTSHSWGSSGSRRASGS
ncbi:hypothetical protein N7540_002284 [Penicillium herquei]|nr:hypothetical protein N7540_002284 [Penicillium herquei]